jgi:hypothetical protein
MTSGRAQSEGSLPVQSIADHWFMGKSIEDHAVGYNDVAEKSDMAIVGGIVGTLELPDP